MTDNNFEDMTNNSKAKAEAQLLSGWALALLDSLSNAVLVSDPDWMIAFVNRAAVRMTGFTPADLHGQRLDVLMPQAVLDEISAHDRRDGSDGSDGSAGRHRGRDPIATRVRRKDGTTFPVDAGMSALDGHAEPHIAIVLHDASGDGHAIRPRPADKRDARTADGVAIEDVIHNLFVASASLHVLGAETEPEVHRAAISIAMIVDDSIRDLRTYIRERTIGPH